MKGKEVTQEMIDANAGKPKFELWFDSLDEPKPDKKSAEEGWKGAIACCLLLAAHFGDEASQGARKANRSDRHYYQGGLDLALLICKILKRELPK